MTAPDARLLEAAEAWALQRAALERERTRLRERCENLEYRVRDLEEIDRTHKLRIGVLENALASVLCEYEDDYHDLYYDLTGGGRGRPKGRAFNEAVALLKEGG